ncbi:unnamed protein product, partial [Rotaria magnacalcarata]
MALQDYTFKIEHVKGNKNCVADCLSRYPVGEPFDDEIEQRSIAIQTEIQPSILKHHQQEDNSIKKIIENTEKTPLKIEYYLNNGILCRNVKRINRIIAVPVIPKTKIKDVLLAYHNSPMNGAHLGIDRTYYKIRDRFYWPRMYYDIAQHIKSCPNCNINKYSRKKPNGYLNPVDPPVGVWENLSMDFVGPITPPSAS